MTYQHRLTAERWLAWVRIAAVPFAFVVQRAAIAFPNFAAVRDELSRWMPSTKPSGQNVVAQQMSEEAEISSCTAERES